jgi:predicted alpha/beta-hydrolase family hydrolase
VLINGEAALGRIIFAHGAGAGMRSDFMQDMTMKMVEAGFQVVRFEFPYMQKMSAGEGRRPPDRMPKLIACFEDFVGKFEDDIPLYLAGKSMGGRVATMLTSNANIKGCFVFGYPFHPAGKPEKLRTEHLLTAEAPIHIFQGTRDRMGSFSEVSAYNLSPSVSIHWLEDGDHDLKPRKASGYTQNSHQNHIVSFIKNWVN